MRQRTGQVHAGAQILAALQQPGSQLADKNPVRGFRRHDCIAKTLFGFSLCRSLHLAESRIVLEILAARGVW
jgi:hypothetical protein